MAKGLISSFITEILNGDVEGCVRLKDGHAATAAEPIAALLRELRLEQPSMLLPPLMCGLR
jgi:hypothetical protein